jgi:hypothetical protein
VTLGVRGQYSNMIDPSVPRILVEYVEGESPENVPASASMTEECADVVHVFGYNNILDYDARFGQF